MPDAVAASLREQLAGLRTFASERSDRIAFHAVLLLAAVAFILWARRAPAA